MRAHTSMIAAAAVVSLVAGSVRPAADAPSADRVVPADGVTAAAAVAAAATVEADEPAVRLSGPRPVSTCQQIAYVVGAATGASQVVAIVPSAATSTTAVVQLAALTSRGWECGPAFSGRIGRNGVRPLLQRRSGDGTTPAGVFPLGQMTAWDGE
ncbi:MAG: hypothetical protein ACKOYG_07680, partial [Ilumatobacteraceae bacterium]